MNTLKCESNQTASEEDGRTERARASETHGTFIGALLHQAEESLRGSVEVVLLVQLLDGAQ